jgi:hypothetical protein
MVDQQWHLMQTSVKTNEKNSGRLLVASTDGMFAGFITLNLSFYN